MESDYRYSEQAFVNAIHHHDPSAFNDLYDHYAGAIYALIRKLMPDDLIAEQLFFDVFETIWNTGQTFNPAIESSFVWIFRITVRICIGKLNALDSAESAPTLAYLNAILFNDLRSDRL